MMLVGNAHMHEQKRASTRARIHMRRKGRIADFEALGSARFGLF